MRIVTHGVAAVAALLIGLGVGYILWAQKAADLEQAVRREQADCEVRVAEATRRAQTAEQRAQQEMAARRVVEDALHQASPQK
jgi:C4-dicarboxylate-specific signal transduction histidine kinase